MKGKEVIYHPNYAKAIELIKHNAELSRILPPVAKDERTMLSQVHIRLMSDAAFTIFYNLPMSFIVSDKARALIEQRRRKLNLKRPRHAIHI